LPSSIRPLVGRSNAHSFDGKFAHRAWNIPIGLADLCGRAGLKGAGLTGLAIVCVLPVRNRCRTPAKLVMQLPTPCPGGKPVPPVGDDVQLANRYVSCRVSSAQMMRAFLFATATAARLKPCSWTMRRIQQLRASCLSLRNTAPTTERAPWTNKARAYRSPRLLIPSRRSLPPLPCWRGTRPRAAANCRPLGNWRPSPKVSSTAVAVSGPMPSIATRRWHAAL